MFPDPEVLYGKLTSGDAGSIREVGAAVSDAKSSMQSAADTISSGALSAAEKWRGEAVTRFLARAKESSTAAGEMYRRLQTAEVAIGTAAKAYTAMATEADAAIKPWRQAKDLPDDERRELALKTMRKLMGVRTTYESRLNAVAANYDTPDTGGGDWDEADISGVNPGDGWVSQGLAYDGENLLVSSYYDLDDQHADPNGNSSRLTYVDYETGQEAKNVYLGGIEAEGPRGQIAGWPPPNHAGGVATHGDKVWVTSTSEHGSQVYVYDKDKLDNATGTKPVPPEEVVEVPASSYVSYADGKLFVGDYYDNKLYELDVDDNGIPAGEGKEYGTPGNVQGVLVREDEFVFSSSNKLDGELISQDRDWDGHHNPFDPRDWGKRDTHDLEGVDAHGIEELVEVDGELVLAHEAGADNYFKDDPDVISEDDKFTEPELTKIDFDEVDLDPDGALGYESDPASLTSAAGVLDEATSTLQGTARTLSSLQLPPHNLGDVPAAASFAAATTRYLTDAGDTVRAGSQTVAGIADGVVSAADTYRQLDGGSSTVFGKLGDLFGS